jgi:hypothetical protein
VSNKLCIAHFETGRCGSNSFPFKRNEKKSWIAVKLALYKRIHGRDLHPETYIPFHFAMGILAEELGISLNWSKFAAVQYRVVCPSDKAHVCQIRHIQAYLNIFKYILENIQRICQPRLIANGHVRSSVRPFVTSL